MIRRPPRSTLSSSSAASDVYKRQILDAAKTGGKLQIQISALKTLLNVATQEHLQVDLAHTKGLIDHLVAMLDSDSEEIRDIAKDILTRLSENEELQNIME
eukprot:TRINITY_DN18187_c0_g1_i1.p1 TRINITY_DN18187_c0_g1~~TRINITY_DN18187_c0_g1_i1.p1  ORF type:complete len:101 (-),score=38.45 TRINITY_DN18187_c0_g1_i1:244-546(-)